MSKGPGRLRIVVSGRFGRERNLFECLLRRGFVFFAEIGKQDSVTKTLLGNENVCLLPKSLISTARFRILFLTEKQIARVETRSEDRWIGVVRGRESLAGLIKIPLLHVDAAAAIV